MEPGRSTEASAGPYPEPNRLATASLVASLLLVWPVGLGLGIAALRQLEWRAQAGRERALGGITISAVVGVLSAIWLVSVAPWEDPIPSGNGHGVTTGLRAGDCFDADNRMFSAFVAKIDVVSCTKPHMAEAFAIFDVAQGSEYPGDAEMARLASARCDELGGTRLAETAQAPDRITVGYYVPNDGAWQNGSREVTCYFVAFDGAMLTERLGARPPGA